MQAYCKRKIPLVFALLFLGCVLFPTSAVASGGNDPRIFRFPAGEVVQQAPEENLPELSPVEQKLDARLLQIVKPELVPEGQPVSNAIEMLKQIGELTTKTIDGNEEYLVNVYVEMKSNADFGDLNSIVTEITSSSKKYSLAVVNVEVDKLLDLAAVDGVKSIQCVTPPICRAGTAKSEGDALLRADLARTASGATGAGVKVGIISDGATNYASSVASGDLPAGVSILSIGSGDEGTAMMEIVHDLAPEAQLYFHDCGDNVLEFNAAIDELVAAGCTIVCDDIGWITEPFFEDGIVASHVKDLIAQNNIIYVSSAGNAADSHYQGAYRNDGTNRHDFSGGTSTSYKDLYVHLTAGHPIYIVLEWNDAFDNSANNYDLYLGSTSRGSVYASSTTVQNGSQDPLEVIAINPSSTRDAAIWVTANGSPLPRTLEVYIYGDGGSYNYTNNTTQTDSIFGHPAVLGALACGAIDANSADGNDYNVIEFFSSQGPVMLLDGTLLQKPDLCGADGTHVTGAGGFSNPFYGTSAAAPHVAAVAALLWSEFPTAPPTQIRQVLMDSSVDYGVTGYDNIYGNGRVDALNAVQDICTVTFESRGGSNVDPVMTLSNGIISAPSAPTKQNYIFDGWCRELACLTKWNFSADTVTQDITLYAKWISERPCTVTFDSQGGTTVESQIVDLAGLVTPPTSPTKDTYLFGGWYREVECVTPWDFESDTVTDDITLYARWLLFEGSGTDEDPYLIHTADDIVRVAQVVNSGDVNYGSAHYLLTSNISLSAIPNWTSIGNSADKAFKGTFDGNNHSISNLKQNVLASNEACAGLFGYVSGGIVENCKIEGCAILASVLSSSSPNPSCAGSIVGYLNNNGSIKNCSVTGSVKAISSATNASSRQYAGGIVGYVTQAAIESSTCGAQITASGQGGDSYAGGIAAYAQAGTVKSDCYTGTLSATSNSSYAYAGGIVGFLNGGTASDCSTTGSITGYSAGGIVGNVMSGTVEKSWNTGTVNAYSYSGGIAGVMNASIVRSSYNIGEVKSSSYSSNEAGGIAGRSFSNSTILNCFSTGSVKSSTGLAFSGTTGGIVGDPSQTTISCCYSIGSFSVSSGSCYVGGIIGNNLSNLVASNCYYFDRVPHGAGLGADTGTAITAQQLLSQATFAGFDFGGTWTMAGSASYPYPELIGMEYAGDIQENTTDFAGGSGLPTDPYQISTKRQLYNVRKFLDACFILKNDIEFTDADFAPDGEFYNDGQGFAPIGTKYTPFSGVFDGDGHIIRGMVSNFEHTWYAYGGLFGYIDCGTVMNLSLHDGEICATVLTSNYECYAGGFAGYMQLGILQNCCYTGRLSTVTVNSGEASYAGGLIGAQYGGSIRGCYNTASVEAKTAGGIAAISKKDSIITNCYNTGAIRSGAGWSGGIVGNADNNCSISNCYNTGDVSSATGGVSGIAGSVVSSLVNNCYFLDNTTQGIGSGIGTTTKLTDAQMRLQGSYDGFDFGSVWTMTGNASYAYPELQAVSQVCAVTFNSQQGSAVAGITAKYNTLITAPATPTRTGYTFDGWYKEETCENAWNFDTDTVMMDIILFAKWTINNYTVTFDSQGGSAVEPQTALYNTVIAAPADPVRADYTFGGWYKEAACTNVWVFATDTIPDHNITLYAKWVLDTFTVSFNSQGGTAVAPVTVQSRAKITAPMAPTRTGYSFQGWYKESVCTTAWDFANDTVTADITLYAKWISTTPTGVSAASASYSSIKVSWAAVPGAAGYQVYRATSSTGTYALAGTVTVTSFTNTGLSTGTTYYYKVRSYKGTVYSSYSSVVSAKPVPVAPTSPKAVAASYNSIKVTWAAVSGASRYEVYRATSSTGSYALLTTTSYLYYTNTSVNTGTTYYYKVRAYRLVGSTKVYGAFSSIVSAKTTIGTPGSVKAAPVTYSSIKVTWSAVTGASGYVVYRATSSTGAYASVGTATSTSFTNTNTGTGITYYYKVRAYRTVGSTKVYGSYSAAAYTRTSIGYPTTVRAARASSTSIKVTWSGVSGATRYELWRSTSSGGTYTLVATTASLYCTNSSLTTGRTYYYKVRAYHLEGTTKVYGPWSRVVYAKP